MSGSILRNATIHRALRNELSRDENTFLLKGILSEIKKVVTAQQFDLWFSSLSITSITENTITFMTPSNFVKEWLQENYLDVFSSIVYKTLNLSREVLFLSKEEDCSSQEMSSSRQQPSLDKEKGTSYEKYYPIPLPFYNFENFVVGACNRLAHAAAIAVSESPGHAYNPLFIHGPSGLGKTHLLHAINNAVSVKHGFKCLYLSCERFLNHYISTIRSNNWESFRKMYRNADVLLIDDIQFFKNSQGCREEFFHTFNALYNARKQIVITCDSPPESIDSLEDRLVSRFRWGLLCGIESPNIETRTAIVEKKANLWGLELTHEVALYLAENIFKNIRELEGAIARLSKESKITKDGITLDVANKVIREITGNRKVVKIESVIEAISKRYDITVSQLLSKSKISNLTLPRQIAMHLSRKLTNMSLNEIGGYIGGRDHSTVIHADKKILRLLKNDKNLTFILQKLENDLLK